MEIAIVILNWNGKQLLEKFLPTVLKYSQTEASIYVADNASTDDSISFVKEHYPNITIIENKINGGYAKGYNDALTKVNADVYCLLNSDIEVTKEWLTPVIKTFKEEPNTAIIQPKILDYKDKTKFEYAGAAGGFIDKYGYPFCRGRLFDTLEEDQGQYNDTREIFWATGACMFIRSSVFNELGGFDSHYFAHQEEIDLCWRAFNKGYTTKYIGSSTVYHVGGATLNEGSPQKTYLNFRNSLFNLVKNLPKGSVFTTVFIRLVLDGIAAIKFLTTLKFAHIIAILKAHFSFYKYLPSLLKKRKELTQQKSYYYINSIVKSYFISGIKEFKKLL